MNTAGVGLIIAGVGFYLMTRQTDIADPIISEALDVIGVQPRGIANNNPGNIEYTGDQWQGIDSDMPSDGRFVRFTAPEYGIRAMGRILNTYRDKYGANTIYKIINRWSPPNENNTASYIDEVANKLDIAPHDPVPYSLRPHLIAAMIKRENGVQPYSLQEIEYGLSLA